MRIKCELVIDCDAETTIEEIIDFLDNCGEDVNTDVKVLKIEEIK